MRTLTSAQSNQLGLANRSVNLRVRVDRGGGDFVDLTDLEDRSFVDSISYGSQIDKPIVSAVVKIRRESYDLSLSPLHDTSKLNVSGTPVSIGNPIIIETATIGQDQPPGSADWVEIFRGQIDEIDLAKPSMVIKCRDDGGRLIDHFAEDQHLFPVQELSADNQMEDVIQDVVDFHNEDLASISALVTWDGTLTATLSDTSGISVGDFVGIRGGDDSSAFFPIASIVASTSFTVTNPQGRTVPNVTGSKTSKIPAAIRQTLFSPGGSASVPFLGSDAPGFQLNRLKNEKEAVLPFVRRIALLIGWEIGYRYQETVESFELQLYAPSRSVAARGTITLTGIQNDGDTFTLDGTVATARTVVADSTNEFLIGATAAETATNIANMMNAPPGFIGFGSVFFARQFAAAVGSTVVITWNDLGSVGNSITFVESLINATVDGGGFLGGTRAGFDPSTIAHTFSPDRYRRVEVLKISRKDIRNVIRVTFVDPVTNNRVTVIRSDASSIAKYGRRYAEFTEGSASSIDTILEAVDFADAALADLREPDLDQSILHDYFWPVQTHDLVVYKANDRHYTADQTLSIVGYRHSLKAKGDSTTVITASGKPAGGRKRWFDIEGRRGIAPPIDAFIDSAASGVVLSSGIGMIALTLDDPRAASPPVLDWSLTRVHMQAGVSTFAPSSSNLVAQGKQLRFEIGDLVPGADYAFVVIVIDEAGNESASTTFIVQATQKIGPFHENTEGASSQLVRNPDFNIFTQTTSVPPDFWTVREAGSWASEIDVVETVAGTFSGDKAVTIDVTAGVEPALESDFVPFLEGDVLIASVLAKGDITPANTDVRLAVEFFRRSVDLAATYTWDGTTTILTGDTSAVAVGDRIRLDTVGGAGEWFNILSIVSNVSVTVENPNSANIPSGSSTSELRESISTDETAVTVANGSFGSRNTPLIEAPDGTKFYKYSVRAQHAGTNYELTIDRASTRRGLPTAARDSTGGQTVTGTPTPVDWTAPAHGNFADAGVSYDTSADEWTILVPGLYGDFRCILAHTSAPVGSFTVAFQNDIGSGFVDFESGTTGSNVVSLIHQELIRYEAGDRLRVVVSITIPPVSLSSSSANFALFKGVTREDTL